MKTDRPTDKNSLGYKYKLGVALEAVLYGCIAAILIALTVKLILWMF